MIKDHPIFLESIKYIRSNIEANNFNYLENKVLERLVHTSGDFNIQFLLEFSENACEKGIKSIKEGILFLTFFINLKSFSLRLFPLGILLLQFFLMNEKTL